MKIVATVKYLYENSPNPDHWVMRFESRVFSVNRSLSDVISWAKSHDQDVALSDIVFSEFTGESL